MPKFLNGLTDPDVLVPIVVVMAVAIKFGVVASGPKAPEWLKYSAT